MKKYSVHILFIQSLLLILLLGGFSVSSSAQIIEKVKSRGETKVRQGMNDVVTTAKGKTRMSVSSSKRALKGSLKGNRAGGVYEGDPVLDELIDDPEVKAELRDNTNKKRYVELFGLWMSMPNDAQIALDAKIRAYRDSIAAIDRERFRVTKSVWNDESREMVVFGWHPHWMGSLYKGYNYDLLNVISYYSYDINPENGAPQNPEAVAGFLTGDFVQTAHDKGCSALLSISCHGEANVTQFLDQNPMAQRNLIDSILIALDSVKADGIEINFSGVNSYVKDDFYRFVRILSNTVTAVRGDTSFVLMSVPPYDPENIYDVNFLQNFVDIFIIKGYDFQETPTELKRMPVAPYNYSAIAPQYDLRSAVEKYLANIGPYHSDRLVLALPNYGTKWLVDAITDEVLDMSMLTYGDVQFEYVMQLQDSFKYPGALNYFDSTQTSHVFRYKQYYEGINLTLGDLPHDMIIYYDDTTSLRKKYKYILEKRLGGVGVQSLGYDTGFDQLQRVMKEEFTTIVMPTDDTMEKVNQESSKARSNGIYVLAVLLYLSIFMTIGLCAALFIKDIRKALFDNSKFRMLYLSFFFIVLLLLGYYLGLFEAATIPLITGIAFGGLVSWSGWRIFKKQKLQTP